MNKGGIKDGRRGGGKERARWDKGWALWVMKGGQEGGKEVAGG